MGNFKSLYDRDDEWTKSQLISLENVQQYTNVNFSVTFCIYKNCSK
jgi:hypothetical protein